MSTSLGRGAVPRRPTTISTDSLVGTIISYNSQNLQNGSNTGITDANGGLTITFPKAFINTPTTVVATVNGAAGVGGPDYTCRLSGKNTTDFTVKVLQGGVNWTSGAVLGSGLNVTTATAMTSATVTTITEVPYFAGVGAFSNDYAIVDTVAGSQTQLYAASSSGGVAGTGFTGLASSSAKPETTVAALGVSNSWSHGTVVTSVGGNLDSFTRSGITTNSGVAVVSVSGFLTAAAAVSVTVDWLAAA